MTPDDIRQFVNRAWAHIAAEKDRRWATAKRTPTHNLRVADQLRRHVQSIRPDWPSEADRAEDLNTHLRVSAALRAVRVQKSG